MAAEGGPVKDAQTWASTLFQSMAWDGGRA